MIARWNGRLSRPAVRTNKTVYKIGAANRVRTSTHHTGKSAYGRPTTASGSPKMHNTNIGAKNRYTPPNPPAPLQHAPGSRLVRKITELFPTPVGRSHRPPPQAGRKRHPF